MVATITPKQLMDLRTRGEAISLVDVRTPAEFGEVHIDFARNVPLDRLDPKAIAAERAGLPDNVRRSCDLLAEITLAGAAESLNVAMAGTIALYEWSRQRL